MFFFAFIATQDSDASVEWFAELERASGLKWRRPYFLDGSSRLKIAERIGGFGKRGNYMVGDGTCSVAGGSVRCIATRE